MRKYLLLLLTVFINMGLGFAQESKGEEVIGKGPTHKGNNLDLIKLFSEHRLKGVDPKVGDMKYYLYDPIAHGGDPERSYPLIVIFHGANNGKEGVMCAAYTDCAVYAGEEYQKLLSGAYILFPKANEAEEEDYPEYKKSGTWKTIDPATGTSIYVPSAAAIVEEVIAKNKIDPKKVAVGGTSAGGFMAWRFLAAREDLVKAAFLIAPYGNPTDEELKRYEASGVPIWIIHGIKDEICTYDKFTGPLEKRFREMKNVRLSPIETVRYGDKGVVKMDVSGIEMGQHLALFCVGANMIYDDGTPYDPAYPAGFIDWLNKCFNI